MAGERKAAGSVGIERSEHTNIFIMGREPGEG